MINDNSNDPFNMVLLVGDIAYAGTGSTWEFEEIWDIWEDQVEPLAAICPWMFSVGNHEHVSKLFKVWKPRVRYSVVSDFFFDFC